MSGFNFDGIPDATPDNSPAPKLNFDGIPDEKPSLHESYRAASAVEPSVSVEALQYKKRGIDPDFSVNNINEARRLANEPSPDFFKRIEKEFPYTHVLLSNKENMAKVHNDIPNIAATEQTIRKFRYAQNFGESLAAGLQASLPGMTFRGGMPDILPNQEASILESAAFTTGQLAGDIPIMGGIGAIALPTAGPVGAMAASFAFPAALKKALQDYYEQGDAKGASDVLLRAYSALKIGAEQGAVGALTGEAGAIAGLATTGAAPLVQTAARIGTEALTMEAAGRSIEGELPTPVGVAEGVAVMGGLGMIHSVHPEAIVGSIKKSMASETVSHLAALDELATTSKWRAVDQEGFSAHINEMSNPALISLEAFNKQFTDPKVAANELGIGRQYDDALKTGTPVSMPMGTFLSKEMDPHREALFSDTKLTDLAPTANESASPAKEQEQKSAPIPEVAAAAEAKANPATITWEAVPSKDLNSDIYKASYLAKREYNAKAVSIIRGEDGVDKLAESLGMPQPIFLETSHGAYDQKINPNALTAFPPETPIEKIKEYAKSLQYIFKQDAVPYFSINDAGAVPGVRIEFDGGLSLHEETVFFKELRGALTEKAGYTKLPDGSFNVFDYDGTPDFYEKIDAFTGTYENIRSVDPARTDSEYGPVQNWGTKPKTHWDGTVIPPDPGGLSLKNDLGAPGRSPASKRYLRDAELQATKLTLDYSGEKLAAREKSLDLESQSKSQAVEADASSGSSPLPPGVDAKTAELHAKLQKEAHESATASIYNQRLKELTPEYLAKAEAEKARITEEVRNEVSQDPLFQAMSRLNPEAPLPTGHAKFEAWYQANDYINGKLSEDNALRFEMVAEDSGFTSANEMARRILLTDAKTVFTSEVNKRVEERMKEVRSKAREDAKEQAAASAHNEKSVELRALTAEIMEGKLLGREQDAEYMAGIQGRARARARQAKDEARVAFDLKPVSEAGAFRPYFTAERDAAVRASKATEKGDFNEAALALDQQLKAHAFAAESLRAREEIRKHGNTMLKASRIEKTYFKGSDAESMFAQFGSILDRFAGGHPEYDPSMKSEALSDWVKRMEDAGQNPDIPDWIQNETTKKPIKDLTMSEFRDVADSVNAIKQVNRQLGKLRVIDKLAYIETIVDQMHDSKVANTSGGKTRGAGTHYTALQKAIRVKDAVRQALISPESLFFYMDGAKDGVFKKTLHDTKVIAENRKGELMSDFVSKYDSIHSEYSKKERNELNSKPIYIPEFKDSFTRNNLIMMWMHQGTEGNQAKLLSVPRKGVQWTQEMVDSVLDRELTKRDMDLGQKRLDLIASYKPEIAALYKRLTGFEPTWVEGQPIFTKHGEYKGGYSPLTPDPNVTISGYEKSMGDAALNNPSAAWKARTNNGYTKDRVAGAKYAVSLDADSVVRHISDVIHDVSMREWVIDAEQILKHKRVGEDLIDALGNDQYQSLNLWLKQIAGNDNKLARQITETVLAETKRRTVAVQLGLKLTTMLRQLDVTVAAGVRPSEFTRGHIFKGLIEDYGGFWRDLSDPLGNVRELGDFVLSKSQYMKERMKGTDRDLMTASQQSAGKNKEVAEFMNSGIGMMDKFVTHSIWKSAYKVGLERNGFDNAKAVLYADDIIRNSNAPGRRSDLPALMRSPGVADLLTMYRGQVDRQLNLMYRAGARLRKAGPAGAAEFASTYMSVMLIPSLMGALISYGAPATSEKRRKWVKAVALENFAGVPIVNSVIEQGLDAGLGIRGSSSLTPLSGSYEAYKNATAKMSSSKAQTQQKIEAAAAVANYTGLPIPGYFMQPIPNQVNTLVFNALDIMDGRMKFEPRDLLRRRPAKERSSGLRY